MAGAGMADEHRPRPRSPSRTTADFRRSRRRPSRLSSSGSRSASSLLYTMMSKLVLPRIGTIIESRQKHIDGDIAEAGRLKAPVGRGRRGLRESAGRCARPRPGDRERDPRQLNAEADANRKTSRSTLNAKLADAEKTIAATKPAAMSNVRGIAEDAAARSSTG